METTTKRNAGSLRNVCAALAFLTVLGVGGSAFAGGPTPPPPPPPPPHYHHHDDWHGGVGFSVNTNPSGHYKTVTETILVEPEHFESYYVQPTFATVIDALGVVQTVKVSGGYWAQRLVPARYETVTRQVWIQSNKPNVNVGVGFRF